MKIRLLLFLLLPVLALNAQTPAKQDTSVGKPMPTPKKKKRETRDDARWYQLPDAKPYAETIVAADMKMLIDTLASDTMGGRETGEPGQRMAADFIAQQFKDLGLPAAGDRHTYFQSVNMKNESWKDLTLKVGDRELKNRGDYYVYTDQNPNMPLLQVKEVVFVGYGIEDPKYNDYGKTDVKGKAVLFYDGEPLDTAGKSLITGTEYRSAWAMDAKKKVKLAKQKGATMAFIVDPNFAENLKNNRKNMSTWGWKPYSPQFTPADKDLLCNMYITPAAANAILGKKSEKAEDALADLRNREEFKPVKVKTNVEVRMEKQIKTLQGSNVIGLIEGTDSLLRNEFVMITAHYDHLGKADDVIYHGADDNASGTSGVIEIARAFAEAKKSGVGPKRSVVCMLVSGEEKGLLGSKFYVDFPIFPLEKTVADINIDMIGRVDEQHAGNPNYIYVIGADRLGPELHEINEYANKTYTQLDLDYKYNAKDDPNRYYERSDHYNFVRNGVPAIFYFSGTHLDYHKPSDTADKIDAAAAAKRAQLAFYTAWDVANRPHRITAINKE